jgi:hypothetical protein
MYIQTGDIGGVIVSEDQPKAKTIMTKNKINIQKRPDKLKDFWGRKICSDYSRMSYWQKVSHCTTL